MFRQEISLNSRLINAAGTLGFAPRLIGRSPKRREPSSPTPSAWPRVRPLGERALIPFPGGFLLHTGFPNPGLSRVLRRYGERWAQSRTPIWVHLLASSPAEIMQMVQRLEGVEGVMAIELGLPPGLSGREALELVQAAYGELPLVVSLPLTCAGEAWLAELPKLGVSAITLSAPRGTLLNEAGRPVSGRLFGPALLPLVMAGVQSLRRLGMQVIAGAAVYQLKDVQALQDAGAWAVQLDSVLWRGWTP